MPLQRRALSAAFAAGIIAKLAAAVRWLPPAAVSRPGLRLLPELPLFAQMPNQPGGPDDAPREDPLALADVGTTDEVASEPAVAPIEGRYGMGLPVANIAEVGELMRFDPAQDADESGDSETMSQLYSNIIMHFDSALIDPSYVQKVDSLKVGETVDESEAVALFGGPERVARLQAMFDHLRQKDVSVTLLCHPCTVPGYLMDAVGLHDYRPSPISMLLADSSKIEDKVLGLANAAMFLRAMDSKTTLLVASQAVTEAIQDCDTMPLKSGPMTSTDMDTIELMAGHEEQEEDGKGQEEVQG